MVQAMQKSFAIQMENISFAYGTKPILNDFNLDIEADKTYCLIGSSGSGKTTTLRLMNGLLAPASGSIKLHGDEFDFSQAEKWRRNMGYSIQGSGLFPHMTLKENLSIIARKEKWEDNKINSRIDELCDLMSLPNEPSFLSKKPRQISGGQQQRVGIARALFMKPKVMLMDEPFSALDPITRSELQKEFLQLQKKLKMTIILVTHDLPEAFSMAHEIVLLNEGKIEQRGRPSKFLLNPATEYVQNFINSHSPGNLLKEIYLYSVLNTNIFSSHSSNNQITLTDLDSGHIHSFQNKNEAEEFLMKNKQGAHYWIDDHGGFKGTEEFGNDISNQSLQGTSHILDAMKFLLSSKLSAIPVVSDEKKLMGVFSEEALRAL